MDCDPDFVVTQMSVREHMATQIFAALIVLPVSADRNHIGAAVAKTAVWLTDKLIDALNQPRKESPK